MSKFTARYPEEQVQLSFNELAKMESVRECRFYISAPGFEKCDLPFRVAFDDATETSICDKDLCACVGSMLCAVSNDLRDSVIEALREIGIKPRYMKLPSQIPSIFEDKATQMDWPLILVHFAYICILVLKNSTNQKTTPSCIHELGKRVGLKSPTELKVPFSFDRENAIRTMLGSSSTLRETLMKFIMSTMNQGRESMHSVCQYLYDTLAWSGMDELILMNEMLVIPRSSVLRDPMFSSEAENLLKACAAIQSHPYPQFFMLLASDVQRTKFDISRFPMLIQIAQKKKKDEVNKKKEEVNKKKDEGNKKEEIDKKKDDGNKKEGVNSREEGGNKKKEVNSRFPLFKFGRRG